MYNNYPKMHLLRVLFFFMVISFCCPYLLLAQNCNLNCINKINISLDEDCRRVITLEDVTENVVCTTLAISLNYPFGTNQLGQGEVDRSHLGHTFIYRVIDQTNNNSCWGYVTVEDKFPPQPLCKNNLKISCFQLAQFMEQVNQPQDNCGQAGKAVISALNWVDYNCDSAILGRVFRTITTYDDWGNTQKCNDTLLIRKDRLPYIKCPDNISLNCRVFCRKPDALGSMVERSNYEMITFSSVKGDKYYPSPELLLKLQMTDTFTSNINKCVNKDSLIVPAIIDTQLITVARNTPYPLKSGLQGIAPKDTCVYVDSCMALMTYKGVRKGGLCKVTLDYTDQITYTCGNSFKIRRQWRISDWCLGRDTVCIQYIKVEDKEKPKVLESKRLYIAEIKPHDCIANISIDKLLIDDCDEVINQDYTLSYTEGHSNKIVLLQGKLPNSVNLPATEAIYGKRCFKMYIDITDRCLNRTKDSIDICVTDITPPTPLCDEYTQVTVDPSVCWARVYAKDLDNGSRDNCCDVLHFAIAKMTDIEKNRADAISKIEKVCGKKEYWDKKTFYDAYIENHINCYVFKDYLDLSDCGEQRVVLRIYEACGVPLYDAHVFPCTPHDWYCYNTSHLFRAELNFNWLDRRDKWYKESKQKDCTWSPRLLCGDSLTNWLTYLNSKLYDDREVFPGSINLPYFNNFNEIFEFSKNCFDLSFASGFMNKAQTVSSYPPGNTCSKYLYNECMVRVNVIDKTFPVCDKPNDLYIYCDGVIGGNEYSNTDGFYCTDGRIDNRWPLQLECKKENDGDLTDAQDKSGKPYGYYGGPILIKSHDDHSEYTHADCDDEYNKWQPIYCKEWLCLDSLDMSGKINYKSYFYAPKAYQGGKPTAAAGKGMFWIYDNCKLNDTISFTDEDQLDKCGKGWLKRTWKAKDNCGNMITCEQKIIAQSRSDFEVIFPQDITLDCEQINSTEKLKPGDITGNAMVMDDECELVGVHYEDVRYDAVDGECYKIVRTWTLTDWCQYDPNRHDRKPDVIVNDTIVANKENRACVYRNLKDNGDGYMQYVQVIKVVDNKKPILTCKDTVFCSFVDNCKERFTIKFKATDNCTPDSLISFRYELDENGDGTVETRSIPNIKLFNEVLTAGDYLATVYASDGCGNEDTCTIKIKVKDCKKPTPYCINGIATVLMPTTGNLILWASDFNAGSFDNCTVKENLKYYFGKKGKDTIGFSSDTFDCTKLGQQDLNIWVVDASGNADKCVTYVLMQDNNTPKVCSTAPLIAINGKITTESNEPVQNVKISLESKGFALSSRLTGSDGKYSFDALPMNTAYQIVPDQNTDWMNGVSTLDLLLIQQHILGTKSLNSMYKIIAADVDNNASLDVIDLLELRKLILGIYSEIPKNKSWRFADKATMNPNTPWVFNEMISKPGDQLVNVNNDFVGIKVGDVNQTAQAHQLLGTEVRQATSDIKLLFDSKPMKAGNIIEVPVSLAEITRLAGFQFTLAFDLSQLDYVGFKKGSLDLKEYNIALNKITKGLIPMSWHTNKMDFHKKDEVLFTLIFKAKASVDLKFNLSINSKITRAEAYVSDNEIEIKNITLRPRLEEEYNIVLHQNTPNPFVDYTIVSFELPKNSLVNLVITDVAGKMIKSNRIDGIKGFNQIRINKSDLHGGGVYYYTLQAGDLRATKKMLLIE